MDIGFQFQNAIEAIYKKQKAKIMINGQMTGEFSITKGVRQGCLLSPLLFIFSLEILLRKIRTDQMLKGTKVGKQEYKTRAFVDDLIRIIEDPRNNIEEWLVTFQEFGELAGFRINKKKYFQEESRGVREVNRN